MTVNMIRPGMGWLFLIVGTLMLCVMTVLPVASAAQASMAQPSTSTEVAPNLPYNEREDVQGFIARMVARYDYNEAELTRLFSDAEYKQSIIDAITRPAEKRLTWADYRKIFLKEDRITQGVQFWREHDELVRAVTEGYAVNPEIIIAVIGVETKYGRIKGSYRVIDSLSTLGFDYQPRAKFFRSELEEFLLFAREEQKDPLTFNGSYAGAMGYGQFIPSSYRHYAVDFDGDGQRNIWTDVGDALGSVANYLHVHGWKLHAPVVHEVKVRGDKFEEKVNQGVRKRGLTKGATLPKFRKMGVSIKGIDFDRERKLGLIRLEAETGPAYWLAEENFYVVTTYNTSRLYAMAVYDLSREILERYCQTAKPNDFVRTHCSDG